MYKADIVTNAKSSFPGVIYYWRKGHTTCTSVLCLYWWNKASCHLPGHPLFAPKCHAFCRSLCAFALGPREVLRNDNQVWMDLGHNNHKENTPQQLGTLKTAGRCPRSLLRMQHRLRVQSLMSTFAEMSCAGVSLLGKWANYFFQKSINWAVSMPTCHPQSNDWQSGNGAVVDSFQCQINERSRNHSVAPGLTITQMNQQRQTRKYIHYQ